MILINGKTVDKLTEDDLITLIGNEDYIESQYIDYKEQFAFWDIQLDNQQKKREIIEFKRDICSFANAEGGCIIVGISEKSGIPKEVIGIDIRNRNKDRFESDIKEKLINIQPKIPSVKVHFVDLKNEKNIVILEIAADGFAPYVYNSGNDVFDFVSRDGNGKRRMSYNQVMRMFNQSLIMQKEIEKFRQNRIQYYSKSSDNPLYCRIYIISEDFVDVSAHKKVYMLHRKNYGLISCPNGFGIVSPNVDGIKFLSYRSEYDKEAYLFNSGIFELNIDLDDDYYLHKVNNQWWFSFSQVWDNEILNHIEYSVKHLLKLGFSKKAYMCFDLACYEGTLTDENDYKNSRIDRNLLMSSVIEVEDISNNEICFEDMKVNVKEYESNMVKVPKVVE